MKDLSHQIKMAAMMAKTKQPDADQNKHPRRGGGAWGFGTGGMFSLIAAF
jgi:hypothetical protein